MENFADFWYVQCSNLHVSLSQPVWAYCCQTGHCKDKMVFAINPGSDAKFAAFKAAAMGQNSTSTASTSIVTVTATITVSNGHQIDQL